MAAKAYILIEVAKGMAKQIRDELEKNQHIKEINIVTGDIDLIAIVEGESLDDIQQDLVFGQIHNINGVLKTVTIPVIALE
ncbi:MAG: Lrp/AsnC ligand binding domain-containing protein [Patescibacteria group bacterium]